VRARARPYAMLMIVPDWVSSLKRDPSPNLLPTKIGFDHATLRWNTGKQSSDETKAPPPTIQVTAPPSSSSASNDSSQDATAVDSLHQVFQLSDLNIHFPIGKLSVISGPTGSGKTALLIALLGEMELLEGKTSLPKFVTQVDPATRLRNSVAYCAQTPWLQQKSIRDNILFGEGLDEERYEATLEACAL
jgi:ABC-type transport system involved in cytochrome bd biosynthesis fused ATPase/permease subunit